MQGFRGVERVVGGVSHAAESTSAGQVGEDVDEGQRWPDLRKNISHHALEQRFSAFSENALARAQTTEVGELKRIMLSLPDDPIAVLEFTDPVGEEVALMVRLAYISARRSARDNETEKPILNYMETQWATFDVSKTGKKMLAIQLGVALRWAYDKLGDRTVFDLFEEARARGL